MLVFKIDYLLFLTSVDIRAKSSFFHALSRSEHTHHHSVSLSGHDALKQLQSASPPNKERYATHTMPPASFRHYNYSYLLPVCVWCVCLCAPAVFWALTIGLVTKTWPSVSVMWFRRSAAPQSDDPGYCPLRVTHTCTRVDTEHRRSATYAQTHGAERQDSEKNRNHRTQTLPVSLTDTRPINTHISVHKRVWVSTHTLANKLPSLWPQVWIQDRSKPDSPGKLWRVLKLSNQIFEAIDGSDQSFSCIISDT